MLRPIPLLKIISIQNVEIEKSVCIVAISVRVSVSSFFRQCNEFNNFKHFEPHNLCYPHTHFTFTENFRHHI